MSMLEKTHNLISKMTPQQLWHDIYEQAQNVQTQEPELGRMMQDCVFMAKDLGQAIVIRLAQRLHHEMISKDSLLRIFNGLLDQSPELMQAFAADILAIPERDPATTRLLEPLLFYKGFHAIQTHRFAHLLWHQERQDMALYLQSRSSEIFQTDIHPAAKFGKGIFLDHATGLVVGGTAVLEDDVSILQNVTLGGTGKERGDRHPKIRHGVLIGAGSKILGNIEVGECARIAAGSVVLKDVPAHMTVAGVPAKVIGSSGCAEPARDMNQILSFDPVI